MFTKLFSSFFLIGFLFAITACGGDSSEDQWFEEVRSVGWEVDHYAFQAAAPFCYLEEAEAYELLSMALLGSESSANMREKGVSFTEAIETYLSATKKHRC